MAKCLKPNTCKHSLAALTGRSAGCHLCASQPHQPTARVTTAQHSGVEQQSSSVSKQSNCLAGVNKCRKEDCTAYAHAALLAERKGQTSLADRAPVQKNLEACVLGMSSLLIADDSHMREQLPGAYVLFGRCLLPGPPGLLHTPPAWHGYSADVWAAQPQQEQRHQRQLHHLRPQ